MPVRLLERVTGAGLALALGVALTSVPALRSSQLPATPAAPVTAAAPAAGPTAATVARAPELPAVAPEAAALPVAPAVPVPRSSARPAPRAAAPPPPLEVDLQARVDAALASLDYPWQELGYGIRFVPYTGGLLGLTDPATRQITVFVKRTSTVQELRVVLAHEIAHALDDRAGTTEQRARYRELRGLPADLAWFPCSGCDDFDSPAGDFAEVFAAWLVGPSDFRSRLAPLPDAATLSRIVPLFAPLSARPAPAAQEPRPEPSPSPSRKRDLIDLSPGR